MSQTGRKRLATGSNPDRVELHSPSNHTHQSISLSIDFNMRSGLTLTIAIVATAALTRVATISHAPHIGTAPTLWAGGAVALSCLPGLSVRALFPNGAARQLAAVTWRMLTMLAALGLAGYWEGLARNCYLTTLLACYFVALPLESWLLIRQCRL